MNCLTEDLQRERAFLELYASENGLGADYCDGRWPEIQRQLALHGCYRHTEDELVYGAKVAWRNSARCIGRLVWRSLVVRDRRTLGSAREVMDDCLKHISFSTNGGAIIPTLTVYDPVGPRLHNSQLIRYADDPLERERVEMMRREGYCFHGTPFEVMPLAVSWAGKPPLIERIPPEFVLEVELEHPEYEWFTQLGLRWHALPAMSNQVLEIGGIRYPCAPFSGWYMGTEIGARDLSDESRYNALPAIAQALELDTTQERYLWKDRALVELNRAVLHSFQRAGVTMVDHHTASRQFLQFLKQEEASGREVSAEWSWIVPPMSGSATGVFHTPMRPLEVTPRIFAATV